MEGVHAASLLSACVPLCLRMHFIKRMMRKMPFGDVGDWKPLLLLGHA